MTKMDEIAHALQGLREHARKLTRNDADAEDLLQDVFLYAATRVEAKQPDNLGAWLNRLVYFRFMHSLRHPAGKRGKYWYGRNMVSLEEFPGYDVPCDERLENQYYAGQILDEIAKLPSIMRDTLVMVADNHDHRTISETHGVTRNTVKDRLRRGRQRLAQLAA